MKCKFVVSEEKEHAQVHNFYIYIKRDPCPYLEKARKLLQGKPVVERPFTDTDTNSLPEHKLAFQKLIPPISSPQIFHGLRFIPGGADGLEQYFAKLRGADEKSVIFMATCCVPACRAAVKHLVTMLIL